MNPLILLAAAVIGAAGADTTVTVRQGDLVLMQNLSGEVHLTSWGRDVMEVVGEDGERVDVTVRRSGNQIVVRPDDRRSGRQSDLEIRLPEWVEVEIGGVNLDVTVAGMRAGVTVHNVNGDIEIDGVQGRVSVTTVEGEVVVASVRGDVRVEGQGDGIRVEDVVGNVWATAGDGDIDLLGIDSREVHAETLEGDVTFHGPIHPAGTYAFLVHEGDVELTLPSDVGAEFTVSVFDGDFESDFPVRVQSYATGESFSFTLGGGGAQVSIRVFEGEIKLHEGRE